MSSLRTLSNYLVHNDLLRSGGLSRTLLLLCLDLRNTDLMQPRLSWGIGTLYCSAWPSLHAVLLVGHEQSPTSCYRYSSEASGDSQKDEWISAETICEVWGQQRVGECFVGFVMLRYFAPIQHHWLTWSSKSLICVESKQHPIAHFAFVQYYPSWQSLCVVLSQWSTAKNVYLSWLFMTSGSKPSSLPVHLFHHRIFALDATVAGI